MIRRRRLAFSRSQVASYRVVECCADVFEATAYQVVRDQVLSHEAELFAEQHPDQELRVDFNSIVSRRIMMPTHIVECVALLALNGAS